MKKLWIALLSAMVVFAIAMPASAVDVKFSGTYHVWGVFDKNHSLLDNENAVNATGGLLGNAATGVGIGQYGSQAFFQQRLRMQTEFKVVEGLTLVTRFDALEKKWGDRRWAGAVDSTSRAAYPGAAGDARVQENIEFERAYVDFNTGIGKFLVGYQNFLAFGTLFVDSNATRPGIKYILPIGPVAIIAAWEKMTEGDSGRPTSQTTGVIPEFYNDTDADIFDLGFVWKGQSVEAGAILQWGRTASARATYTYVPGNAWDVGTYQSAFVLDPYFKATFGPVYIEGEAVILYGKLSWENPIQAAAILGGAGSMTTDVDMFGYGLYLGARADFAPVYFGLQFAYITGDDPATPDKREGGFTAGLLAGQAYNPALMMFNDDFHTWVGDRGSANYRGALTAGRAADYVSTFLDNCWFYHIYVGVKPVPKADIKLAFTYATAQKKPWASPATAGFAWLAGTTPNTGNPLSEYNSDKYGYELDLVASYKIYDNLEYMIGAGYFWPGDYFKGNYNAPTTIPGLNWANSYNFEPALSNDYLLMHKLTLSF